MRIASEVERTARNSQSQSQYDMEMAFSRGLYTGWFDGINNQKLVHARFGKKRGVYLGEVKKIQGEKIYSEAGSAAETGRWHCLRCGPAR